MARKKTRTAASKGKKTAKTAKAKKPAKVSWLPKKYPVLSPITLIEDCKSAISWYKQVFGAKERLRLDGPGGSVAHCELGFGDSVVMMGNPMPPEHPATSASLSIYVKDCDATYARAIASGARSIQAPEDQFYGDRSARFEDPFGNQWGVATHVKEVSAKQMKAAMESLDG